MGKRDDLEIVLLTAGVCITMRRKRNKYYEFFKVLNNVAESRLTARLSE